MLSQAGAATVRNALIALAELYLTTDRFAEARDVLQRAEDGLRLSDAPNDWAVVDAMRAVVDRRLGTPDEAARRLGRLHSRIGETEIPWVSAVAHWLSAVLARESGDPVAARPHLRQAWVMAEQEADPLLILCCLAERSAQLVGSDPSRALEHFALVVAHDDEPTFFAVDYLSDVLPELHRSLGTEVVATAMREAGGTPLTLPCWED